MDKIKAAVIGLGRIASLLEEDTLREKPCTHAGAIAANEDCILTAGCDTDEERRSLFAEKWNVQVYADAAEMLRIHKPQILSIATHPDSHYHYCRLAALYNIPVVICEKPLADTIGKARKIADLAKQSDLTIITNHERRYSQDYIRAKEILKSGNLGAITAVRACLYMGLNRRLIDQLWHDGTHLADIIMYLTDSVLKHNKTFGAKLTSRSGTAWLEGKLRSLTTEYCCPSYSLEKHGDFCANSLPPSVKLQGALAPVLRGNKKNNISFIPVLIEIGAGRDHLVFEIEFSCEKGRLRIGNGVFEVYESVPSPYAEKFNSLKNTDETFSCATGYFANMIKDAVACIKETQRTPVSGAIDGLRVIEYLNSVKKWQK